MMQKQIIKGYTSSQIREILYQLLEDKLGVDRSEIEEGSNMITLGADSLDAIEIIMDLEKIFDIAIPDEVAENMNTFSDMYQYFLSIKEIRKLKLNEIEKNNI
jgi:acyl carrier protein